MTLLLYPIDTPWRQRSILSTHRASYAVALRQALLALTQHPRECGAGVTVSRYWRQGNVDYKRIPVLKGLDLSPWRGTGREDVRVSLI